MRLLREYDETELRGDGYPHLWPEIKAQVVAGAGHRCARCGHPYPPGIARECPRGEWTPCDDRCTHEGPCRVVWEEALPTDYMVPNPPRNVHIEARWRILTVHHLTGSWGKTHEAKANCLWWNLLPLCQRCHLEIQGRVDPDRPWPWAHSEWFRPYAAGFYAWKYGALEFDPRDEETIEEWLRVGMREDSIERMPL